MNQPQQPRTGRPPLTGERLPNPRGIRYGADIMAVAREIADAKFGGNLSRALRELVSLGALVYRARQEQGDDGQPERS